MVTVRDKPQGASEDEQYLFLTRTERDDINNLIEEKFGKKFLNIKKEKSTTPFEYSCHALYEFLNLPCKFAEE